MKKREYRNFLYSSSSEQVALKVTSISVINFGTLDATYQFTPSPLFKVVEKKILTFSMNAQSDRAINIGTG